ncbi:hypothetical protein DL765_011112 [Monosporascus sp. GIB2]|nr:hypothetical protein DL765_011112 [Monosporascus sp. GIB2]
MDHRYVQSNNISDAAAPIRTIPWFAMDKDVMHIPGHRYGKKFKYAGSPRSSLSCKSNRKPNRLANFLKGIKAPFLGGQLDGYTNVVTLHDDTSEKMVEFETGAGTVGISQSGDVNVQDSNNYYQAQRALETEAKSTGIPRSWVIVEWRRKRRWLGLCGGEKTEWYKKLREQAIRSSRMENDKQARDKLREISKNPEEDLQPVFPKIKVEDASLTTDYFYQHPRGNATASDPANYQRIEKCLFRAPESQWRRYSLFGITALSSVSSAPPSRAARHSVVEFILRSTGAEHGVGHDAEGAGIAANVARFPTRHPVPEEYETCIEAFSALPAHTGMAVSRPNWVTLFVSAVNSFERHHDRHGFSSLVPLGDIAREDLCFPQLGLKQDYKPGGCVVFLTAEQEQFLEDRHRSRMLVIWLSGCDDENEYDSCVTEEIDVEKLPEGGWTDADIHGTMTWSPAKNAYPMEPLRAKVPARAVYRVCLEATQERSDSYVTYTCIPENGRLDQDAPSEPTVTLLERRYLISGSRVTGFRTWEGSLHLASYLLTETGKGLVKGKGILELGAGTGLLSILCAKHLQARHVTTTDGDDSVVEALKKNIVLNGLRSNQHVVARTLNWGDDLEATWVKQDCKARPYDVVIGADITYDKVAIKALVTTIHQLFELRPGLRVLISGVVRNVDTFASFRSECLR